jgi:hypothetical protein
MAVPLLNWSKSIRDLSLEKSDDSDRRGFSKARTIVIYWGFLVVVGLASVLVLITVPETASGTKTGYTSFMGTALDEFVSCTIPGPGPANTTFVDHKLHLVAENGTRIAPIISKEWAANYSCSNPCGAIAMNQRTAIFRQPDDYELASDRSLAKVILIANFTSTRDRLAANFQLVVRKGVLFVLPYVISQGIWASAFGRRSPTQTRDALYLFLRDGHAHGKYPTPNRVGLHPRRKIMAKLLALCTYFWTLFVTIISMPVLFVTILAVESYLHGLPESAALTSIDSWSQWAGAGLVLVAALISQFHNRAVAAIRAGSLKKSLLGLKKSSARGAKHLSLPIWTWMCETPSFEWKSFWDFWQDADNAVWFDRHGRRLIQPINADQMRAVHTVGSLPLDLNTVLPRTSWLVHQKATAGSGTQPLTAINNVGSLNASTSTLSTSLQEPVAPALVSRPTEIRITVLPETQATTRPSS